jgi:hypothetical protein
MQVEIRNHIARCLRDYPDGFEHATTVNWAAACVRGGEKSRAPFGCLPIRMAASQSGFGLR